MKRCAVRQIRQRTLTLEGVSDTIDGDKWSIDGEGGEVVRRSAGFCPWCTSIPGNSRGGSNCNLLETACCLIYSWNRLTMHADAECKRQIYFPGV